MASTGNVRCPGSDVRLMCCNASKVNPLVNNQQGVCTNNTSLDHRNVMSSQEVVDFVNERMKAEGSETKPLSAVIQEVGMIETDFTQSVYIGYINYYYF